MGQGLSESDLDDLIGTMDYRLFLNPKNELYREQKMKESPPPRREAIRLMARNPNLIRRPLFARGKKVVPGFDIELISQFLA